MEDYKLSPTGNTVVAEPVYKTPIREGDTVLYRTRSDELDASLKWNHVQDGNPIWRPAHVVRVWGSPAMEGILNLQVLADGEPSKNGWRASVPHISNVPDEGMQAWRRRDE